MENILNRKSVRKYTKEEVKKEQLEMLVRAGMAAPSARNSQPWLFFVIDDRTILDNLAKQLPNAKMLLSAKAAIVVCGNLQKALEGDGREFWVQDCSAATQNILLAAESMGLGAVWTGA
ncbi:MAG: nitroreductase family protein, partial [Bacteroidales bacterium]|nr:nitroreductase family protein [Bacteroidales bacterium]